MKNQPLLSIAIPTFNRALYLRLCLSQLVTQLHEVDGLVEVNVYDNNSTDNTKQIIAEFITNGAKLNYYRNAENIGSDKNVAQCFNRAYGQYVLILGDDDVLIDGSLSKIINAIRKGNREYGAIFIKAYGYNKDFRKEQPFQILKRHFEVCGVDQFFQKCSSNIAFISSLVINKSKIQDLDANQFIGTYLVQTYLLYEAIRNAKKNLFVDEYLVAAKRIENRDYDVTYVFSECLNVALDHFVSRGLNPLTAQIINRELLWYFYPMFLISLRRSKCSNGSFNEIYLRMRARYKHEPFYWLCVYPVLKFPKQIAIFWGVTLIVISRIIKGEFYRLFVVLKSKIIPNGW